MIIGEEKPGTSKVWETYNALTGKFGSEYTVMLDVPQDQLRQVVGTELAQAILKVRNDEVYVVPGYDGVYGKMDFTRQPSVRGVSDPVGLEQYV